MFLSKLYQLIPQRNIFPEKENKDILSKNSTLKKWSLSTS